VGHLLVRIGAQIHEYRPGCDIADAAHDVSLNADEIDLPIVPADRVQLTHLSEVEDFLARPLLKLGFVFMVLVSV